MNYVKRPPFIYQAIASGPNSCELKLLREFVGRRSMIRRQEFFVSKAQAERRRTEELKKDEDRRQTLKRIQQEKVLEANQASDERVENKR